MSSLLELYSMNFTFNRTLYIYFVRNKKTSLTVIRLLTRWIPERKFRRERERRNFLNHSEGEKERQSNRTVVYRGYMKRFKKKKKLYHGKRITNAMRVGWRGRAMGSPIKKIEQLMTGAVEHTMN